MLTSCSTLQDELADCSVLELLPTKKCKIVPSLDCSAKEDLKQVLRKLNGKHCKETGANVLWDTSLQNQTVQ